ncbi:hypothetical protein OG613_32005 [Streptomyces sp. NBC_00015]|uniref:hypothetical protein n=1 Tax=unclassified Streptomyces TaxID=2593676 RepID=UPI0022519925|nr:hypothetical protein [Streptomyces sp. NBC_00103]MCX5367641.1 hypothetical protein [Streptomyces sp. NBC_00103]
MITPTDDFDDGPDLDPDDPLTVILGPVPGHLGPPPGRYEEIRRGAVRRRLLRTAAGVGATCGIAALAVLLPLRLTASDAPPRPTVPLAPPSVSGPPTAPPSSPPSSLPPSPSRDPERPTEGAPTPAPDPRTSAVPAGTAAPTIGSDDRSESPEPTTAGEPGTSSAARPTPSAEPSQGSPE